MSAPPRERTVDTAAGRAFSLAEGEGPCVVFSHSLACDHRMWDAQAARLHGRFTVLRYDIRGHGRSEAPPPLWSIDELADDLRRILDAHGIGSATVVGLSLGGLVAQAFAAADPARVDRLVLADTTSVYPDAMRALWAQRIEIALRDGLEPLVAQTLERWFTAAFLARAEPAVESVAAMIRGTSREGYVGCCAVLAGIDLRPRLAAIRCPTLVLVGEHDSGTPVAMARDLAAGIAGSRLQVLADAAHLSNLEQPEAFSGALEAFLTPP